MGSERLIRTSAKNPRSTARTHVATTSADARASAPGSSASVMWNRTIPVTPSGIESPKPRLCFIEVHSLELELPIGPEWFQVGADPAVEWQVILPIQITKPGDVA